MCGRSALGLSEQQLAALFSARPLPQPQQQQYQPNFNIRPTNATPIVRRNQGQTELVLLNWGFEISKSSKKVINARCEGISHKPMFRSLLDHHRCVMPTVGFYEWTPDKRPHLIRVKDQQLTNLACLYNDAGNFVIITCNAAPEISKIHNRMPVILTDDGIKRWLDVDQNSFSDCQELLHPFQGELEFWQVKPLVGIDESCVKPAVQPSQSSIASFMSVKREDSTSPTRKPDRKRHGSSLQAEMEPKKHKFEDDKNGETDSQVPEKNANVDEDKRKTEHQKAGGSRMKRGGKTLSTKHQHDEKQQSITSFFKKT